MRKVIVVSTTIGAGACLLLVFALPSLRYGALGRLRGERFSRGHPTSYWIRALRDGDVEARRRAAFALADIPSGPEDAIPPLTGREAEEAVPVLVKALSDEDAVVRHYAIDALLSMGQAAARATPDLIRALRDVDENVRGASARALGLMGGPAEPVVPALTEAMRDQAPSVRVAAATALWHVDHQVSQTVPVLIKALKDNDGRGDVQRSAAWTLGLMGPRAKDAVPALTELLREEQDPGVQRDAAAALRKIQGEAHASQ
jgi:HEAT repeat protein